MSYVMVPVPEEHAAKVMKYLRWGGSRSPSEDWDQTSMQQFLRDVDANALTLIVCVAEAMLDAGPLAVGEVARTIGCSDREVLGFMIELNSAINAAGGPPFTLAIEKPREVPQAEQSPDTWLLTMPHDVARFLLAAKSAVA